MISACYPSVCCASNRYIIPFKPGVPGQSFLCHNGKMERLRRIRIFAAGSFVVFRPPEAVAAEIPPPRPPSTVTVVGTGRPRRVFHGTNARISRIFKIAVRASSS